MSKIASSLAQNSLLIATALVLVGLFLLMGLQPLFLEEPRRSFVAMELIANKNWWVPTQLGQLYYNKPPFFNWVLMLSASLFGGFHEWAMRLPTVLSTIGIGVLVFLMGKKYIDRNFGLEAGLLSITSAGIFFYFSTLAEIDLFYSFITLAMFFAIFYFGEQQRYYLLFFIVYLITAIGFLTKALPSLAFTAISLLTYFIYTKRFKILLSPAHFMGIALFFLLAGGYYYIYAQYQDPSPFLTRLFGESSNRTIAGSGFLQLLKHLVIFPLNTWVDLLPAGLMVIFLFKKGLFKAIKEQPFIKFCFWITVTNILVYWISPGSRQRYVYMLYPLLTIIMLYAYYWKKDEQFWTYKFFKGFVIVLCVLLGMGTIALHFIPDLDFISYLLPLTIIGLPLFLGLAYLCLKNKVSVIPTLILATALGRIIFDLTILPQRADNSDAQKAKAIAIAVTEKVQEEQLYLYWPRETTIINEFDISFITVYYLDLLREDVLRYKKEKSPNSYYLSKKADLNGDYSIIMEFEQRGHEFALVQFKE